MNKVPLYYSSIQLHVCITLKCHVTIYRSAGGIGNFFPWIAKIPFDPFGVHRNFRNADQVNGYCDEIIREHVEQYDENSIDDLTSAYIRELKRHEESNEKTTMSRR